MGLFVLLAAAVFGWLLLGQGKGVGSFPITVGFNTLNNINEATVVKLRGFTIGQVRKIEFRQIPPAGEAYFLLTLAIEKDYAVPQGTIAEIRSSGLVGDSYIHLDVSAAGAKILESGGHIDGRDSPGMKQLIASITDMAYKLGGAGESIRRADLGYKLGRMGDSVHRIAGDLDLVATSADSVLFTARDVIAKMEPKLDRNLVQLEKTLGRTDSLVANTHEDIQGAVKALRQSVERLDVVLSRVDTLMRGKEADIDETLTNLHRASVSVREISEHPWKLITGQGASSDSTATP